MALALCLLFEPRADRLVRQIWERLEGRGVSTLLTHTHGRHHPHLSLAVLRAWDPDRLRAGLAGWYPETPVEVAVQGSVVFPRGRVALACSVDSALAKRQEEAVCVVTAAGAELHRHYERGRWVPHVSLATSASAEQLSVVVNAVSDVLPLRLRADRAALIDTSTGGQWPLVPQRTVREGRGAALRVREGSSMTTTRKTTPSTPSATNDRPEPPAAPSREEPHPRAPAETVPPAPADPADPAAEPDQPLNPA
jgi:2'-5' RNA ligase